MIHFLVHRIPNKRLKKSISDTDYSACISIACKMHKHSATQSIFVKTKHFIFNPFQYILLCPEQYLPGECLDAHAVLCLRVGTADIDLQLRFEQQYKGDDPRVAVHVEEEGVLDYQPTA